MAGDYNSQALALSRIFRRLGFFCMMASEFSLGEFVRDPSAERLSSLTKVELLDVATHYEVVGIKRYLLKSDILNRIVEFLVAEEVLSSEAAGTVSV